MVKLFLLWQSFSFSDLRFKFKKSPTFLLIVGLLKLKWNSILGDYGCLIGLKWFQHYFIGVNIQHTKDLLWALKMFSKKDLLGFLCKKLTFFKLFFSIFEQSSSLDDELDRRAMMSFFFMLVSFLRLIWLFKSPINLNFVNLSR